MSITPLLWIPRCYKYSRVLIIMFVFYIQMVPQLRDKTDMHTFENFST